MNEARDTQTDYVHQSCMWAGNHEAGNLSQPSQFGADDDPPREPMSPAERVLLGAIFALSAYGAALLLHAVWGAVAPLF